MKKISSIFVFFCLVILLCACAQEPSDSIINNQPEIIDDLTPLLYGISAGEVQDRDTELDSGEDFFSVERYEKEGQGKKLLDCFGNNQNISYSWTWKYKELPYEIDTYSFLKDYDALFASYRTDTNKIVKYQRITEDNREYKSPVNPYSSEEEYITYAKTLFRECAGISVDDWDVIIQTWREEYGLEDKFINYTHENPSYNAEYIITFSKKISGIDRCDKMYVRMTNVGEVIEFNALNYEQSFEPFADIRIDRDAIEEAAWRAFNDVKQNYNDISSSKIKDMELIAQNKSLWAQVTIEYCFREATGAVQYVFEIAKIK